MLSQCFTRSPPRQLLVHKILRDRIYNSTYWKRDCFALTAETVVDRAVELDYIGGTYGGNGKPTPFLCLILKLLQLQPSLHYYSMKENE